MERIAFLILYSCIISVGMHTHTDHMYISTGMLLSTPSLETDPVTPTKPFPRLLSLFRSLSCLLSWWIYLQCLERRLKKKKVWGQLHNITACVCVCARIVQHFIMASSCLLIVLGPLLLVLVWQRAAGDDHIFSGSLQVSFYWLPHLPLAYTHTHTHTYQHPEPLHSSLDNMDDL